MKYKKIKYLFLFTLIIIGSKSFAFSTGTGIDTASAIKYYFGGDILNPDPVFSYSFGFNSGGIYLKSYRDPLLLNNNLSNAQFDKGAGNSYNLGGVFEIKYLNQMSLQLRLNYEHRKYSLKSEILLPIINDNFAKTEHDLDIRLDYVSTELYLKYFMNLNFFFDIGLSFSKPIKKTYQYYIRLLSEDISYENGQKEKYYPITKIEYVKNKIAGKICIGYSYDLFEERISIAPEVGFEFTFSKLNYQSSFKDFGIIGSLVILYSL